MQAVNSLFGTSIEVDFDSSWLENTIERLLNLKQQSSEASSQLANPAPMGFSEEEDGQEGASMKGVSEQSDEETEKNENGDEGSENDPGELDTGSEDGEGMEESGEGNKENGEGVKEESIEEKIDDAVEKMIDIMVEDAMNEDGEKGEEDEQDSEDQGLSADS